MSIIGDIIKMGQEPYINDSPEGEFDGKKIITGKPSNKRVDEVKTLIVPSIPNPEDSSEKLGTIIRTKSVPAYKKRLAAAERLKQTCMDILEPLNIHKPANIQTQETSEKGQDEEV